MNVQMLVNGQPRWAEVPPMSRLIDVLRCHLGLTGTKEGCGEGECGACSVLIDGRLCNACLIPIAQCNGCNVTTIEGLAGPGKLSALQQAFVEAGAVQCGFCTPGMVLAAHSLLSQTTDPSEEQIREAVSGNLCRCTGYERIVHAIRLAAGCVRQQP